MTRRKTMTSDNGWLERVIGHLKALESDTSEEKKRIMAKVRAEGRGEHEPASKPGPFSWLVRPRVIAVRPVTALVAAFVVILAVVMLRGSRQGIGWSAFPSAITAVVDGTQARVGPGQRLVRFSFVAGGASQVSVVGDFNDWRPGATPLEQTVVDGLWSVVIPLEVGSHQYAFVVDDGIWLPDEHAPRAPSNDFGVANSVLIVPGDA
jgi:hypothetical protein